ncbi:MAG: hypothetical protein IJT94_06875, partial [Oscillibacter sp.]|nr:hypothetical protein [Oscillibacter sp.]
MEGEAKILALLEAMDKRQSAEMGELRTEMSKVNQRLAHVENGIAELRLEQASMNERLVRVESDVSSMNER